MNLRCFQRRLEIASPAKVNWFLELPAKRDDGFHEIETVMSTVSLYDFIRFRLSTDSQFRLTVDKNSAGDLPTESDVIPTDSSNLIARACELVRMTAQGTSDEDKCQSGFDITLKKNIPSAAGLGGASSNAAAALIAVNRLWNLKWPVSKLANLAAQLGSDIPFFLTGGTAVCRGRGEKIESLSVPAGLAIVVAKPPSPLSTATVFSNVSISPELNSSQTLIRYFRAGRIHQLGSAMFNRLQEFAEQLTQEIGLLRQSFTEMRSCLGHQMSGSGSSYFGVFSTALAARQAMNCLSSRHPEVRIFSSQTLSTHHI